MRQIFKQSFLKNCNPFLLVAVCLSVYFSYHVAFGDRGFLSLAQLEYQQANLNSELITQRAELAVLEDRVKRLRPDTLDVDLLEERISYVLGYAPMNSDVILMP